MAFCSAMNTYTLNNKYTINEKNCISLTVYGSSDDECLGLVNLYNDAVGTRGKNASIDEKKLDNLFDFIFTNIENIAEKEQKKVYIGYFVKLLFLIRDHKDGNGERAIFYKLLLRLYEKYPKIVIYSLHLLTGGYDIYNVSKNMEDDKPFGSFLDLNKLYELSNKRYSDGFKENILNYYINCLKKDINSDYPSLAVKWVPREKKKYHTMACDLVNILFSENENSNSNINSKFKKYRKLLKEISDKIVIIEKLMTEKRWDEIEVKNIPSRALKKYLYALKNEVKKTGELRYPDDLKRMELRRKLLEEQNKPVETSKLNVKTLQPYELVQSVINTAYQTLTLSEEESIIAMWNKYTYEFNKKLEQDNILKDNLNMIILADVSGSMSGTPMEACIALSLLLTNMLNDTWKNKILTFESNPRWHNIPEHMNIVEKIRYLQKAPWGGSTNIGKALNMILEVAMKNNIAKEDMPPKMIIFSDMQFDQACDYNDIFKTGFEQLESKFKHCGYDLPHVIFWNLRGDTCGYNNKSSQKGTTMLSGFGPATFKSFMDGKFDIENTPWQTLKNLLTSERLNNLDVVIDSCI